MRRIQFVSFWKKHLRLDLDWNEYVGFDKKYERPAEVDLLIGNPEKAKSKLGWSPQTLLKISYL